MLHTCVRQHYYFWQKVENYYFLGTKSFRPRENRLRSQRFRRHTAEENTEWNNNVFIYCVRRKIRIRVCLWMNQREELLVSDFY